MTPGKIAVTLVLAVSTAAFASQAVAQQGAKRDIAMQQCLQEASKIVGETQQQARAASYKACMTKAGHKP